jgi:hypothetical protein
VNIRLDLDAILTEQGVDLVRYRALVEAQVAVLSMSESSLLDQLGREADSLLDRIIIRDRQIGPIQLSGPQAGLAAQVERARLGARLAADRLLQALRLESDRVGRELKSAGRDTATPGIGYPLPRQALGAPILVDRSA